MMSNVRRVPDEEGLSGQERNRDSAVIVHDHFRALGHARNREISTGKNRGQRIKFDSEQGSLGETPPGRYEVSPGTCARINDSRRRGRFGRPLDHCVNDCGWREGCAFGSPFGRRPKSAKRFSQRVFPRFDSLPDIGNDGLRNLPGIPGKSFLCLRPTCDRTCAKRNGNRCECSFRMKADALAGDNWPLTIR
jgi:hypothetical protein